MKPKPSKEHNNVYAKNIEDNTIHISEAKSGRRGYYCLGCEKELEAVRHKVANIIDYFRHVANDVEIERKCTYRDETYRHKLAKDILQNIKKIKVPAVYKYPPKGVEGLANLINESKYIEAHTVGIERTFYEDENGEVRWGANIEVEEKYLLLKPDVAFFDESGKPILLIELVATHKVDFEKRVKLSRLKIDSVQVNIPRDSPESIQNTFFSTSNTKWIYNYDEERTEYIPVSSGNSEGIPPIDEEQRKFFEESFKCRQAQINNIIRSINRCLESQPYRTINDSIKREILRVTRNTEEARSKLDELYDKYENETREQLGSQFELLKTYRERIIGEEKEFQKYFADLEKRYFRKRSEIESEQNFIDQEKSREIGDLEIRGKTLNQRKEEIDEEEVKIERAIRIAERKIDLLGDDTNTEPGKFESDKERIRRNFESRREFIKREIEFLEIETSGIGGLQKEFTEELRKKEDDLPRWAESEEEQIERELEDLRKQLDTAVLRRDGKGGSEYDRRINRILEARRILNDIEEKQRSYKRYRNALECLKSGTYKSWVK